MRQLPETRALATALGALLLIGIATSCSATSVSTRPSRTAPTAFVIPTSLSNGRIELTIAPAYPIGATLTVPIAIVATRGSIAGPLTARIMASGINEKGAPAEVLVRELSVTPATATAGRASTSVAWDTRDLKGVLVPADAYSLVLEFRSTDGAVMTAIAGATLELR